VLSQVRQAKKTTDFVVVVPHWGAEYKLNIQPALQRQAHQLIDAGADLIIGGHPHVVEPVEVYKNKFIAYSLGNFIFDQYFSTDTQRGLMLNLSVAKHQLIVTIVPLVSVQSQISVATGTARQQLLDRIAAGCPNSAPVRNQIKNGVLTIGW
jgi:gamma-polyglutamate biosynthesis protein CapA